MRGHAVCSGRLSRCPTFRSGKRRARAPGEPQRNVIAFAARRPPRELATSRTPNPRECPRRGATFAIAREKECDRARGKRRATPLLHCLLVRVVRPHVSASPRSSSACRLWLRLRPRLKLSWPAAPWLRAFPRARFSRRGRASLRITCVRSTQLNRALGANAFSWPHLSTAQPLFAACVVAPQLHRGCTFPPRRGRSAGGAPPAHPPARPPRAARSAQLRSALRRGSHPGPRPARWGAAHAAAPQPRGGSVISWPHSLPRSQQTASRPPPAA